MTLLPLGSSEFERRAPAALLSANECPPTLFCHLPHRRGFFLDDHMGAFPPVVAHPVQRRLADFVEREDDRVHELFKFLVFVAFLDALDIRPRLT